MKRILHKALSMLLTVAMVLSMGLTPVFAEGTNPPGISGICTHHTEHTEDCGYQAGTLCNHEHTEKCYTKELTCSRIESEAPGIATDSDAPAGKAHSHGEDCYTQIETCQHKHDTCGYTADSSCTFDPASCDQCNHGGKPQDKVCTCPPVLGASDVGHCEDCPLYTAPEQSEAVTALIAMVDALPNAADITKDNKETTKPAYEAAAMAYEELSDEDKTAFEQTEQYTKLMELTALMTKNGAAPVVPECICPKGGSSRIHIDNCPLYGLEFQVSNARTADAVPEGITVEQTGEFAWDIFANGNPIIIAQEFRNTDYSDIYIDKNGNGTVDEGEKPLVLPGVYEDPQHGFGYFLKGSKIYGGSKTADVAGDTSVTLDGGIVWQIFGGNHSTGTVNGDTSVTINDGTIQYAYGGGAGYSDTNVTYVTGTTHVTLNGGILTGNLYGGGGWRGATVGNSNVTVTGGEVWNVFGGGEEKSEVTGTATVIINCGETNIKGGVYGGGAGFGKTNATVANVNIQMISGYVPQIVGGGVMFTDEQGNPTTSSTTGDVKISMEGGKTQYIYDRMHANTAVTGNVSVAVTGGDIYNGGCVLGMGGTDPTKDIAISVAKDATFAEYTRIHIKHSVGGTLAIDMDGLYVPIILQPDVLKNAEQATLTYRNLGSADGTWAQYNDNPNVVTKGSNPYFELDTFSGNKFDEITFENSYVDFKETGTSASPAGIDTATDKLTLDGGAMRVFFRIDTLFPATEFKNNPLLYYGYHIIGGNFGTSVIEFASATGTAKVQLMARDGNPATNPLSEEGVSKIGFGCVVAPTDTPDGTFILQNNDATEGTCYWGTNTYGQGDEIWKLWQVVDGSSCRCWTGSAQLKDTVLYLPTGSGATSFTLEDVRADYMLDENISQCPIVGHEKKQYVFSYAISESDGTTAADAAISGDQLSVAGGGRVIVAVTASIGHTTKTENVTVYVVEHPTEDYFFNIREGHPANKDIVLTYKTANIQLWAVHNATNKRPSSPGDSGWAWLTNDEHDETHEGDTLTLTIKKEYLEKLAETGLKEYEFEAVIIVDGFNIYAYDTFKIRVSDKNAAVVTITPSKTEGVVYGDKVTYSASVAKGNSADAAELTGTVQFQVDGSNYGEPLALAAASATIDHTKLTVGTHTITATYSSDNNYAADTGSAATTVGRAPIEIKAVLDKPSIYVGDALPTPNIVYEGLVGNDTLTPNTAATFNGMPANSNTVGTHTITWSNRAAMQSEIEALPTYANYTTTYADTIILTIESKHSGGGGGGGSPNNDNPTPKPEPEGKPENGNVNLKPSVDKEGNATVTVSDKNVDEAIKKAQDEAKKNGTEKNGIAVTITLDTNKTLNSFTVNLPKSVQEKLIAAGVTTLTIKGGATITFDLEAIKQIKATANADVVVTATKIVNTSLSKEAQAATGGRPVYDFKVTGGDKNITTFGNGKLSLSIPYELQKVDGNGKPSQAGSFENHGNLVGVYINANGELAYLPGSSYNAASKTMIISTTHLSIYGVAYKQNAPTFTDTATHWAKDDIEFVAARGLLTGTTATTFSPNTSMTRGMFVTALGRLAGVDPNSYKAGSFTDVKVDAYYAPYVNWAVKNNIVTGRGATTFAPDSAITRQEMAVMTANYAKAMGYKLPSVHKEIIFTDSASIGTWAKTAVKEMQMAGILMGKEAGKFDPTGTATRAEVSAMLHRFVELVS